MEGRERAESPPEEPAVTGAVPLLRDAKTTSTERVQWAEDLTWHYATFMSLLLRALALQRVTSKIAAHLRTQCPVEIMTRGIGVSQIRFESNTDRTNVAHKLQRLLATESHTPPTRAI